MGRTAICAVIAASSIFAGCSTAPEGEASTSPKQKASTATEGQASAVPEVEASASPEDKAKTNVTKYLARKLNDPDSYKPAEWGALTPVTGCPNVKHYIQHVYRAKNKFGGYVATTDVFLLKDDLDVYFEMSEDSLSKIRQLQQFADASLEEIIREFADKPE